MYHLIWEVYGVEKKYFNPDKFSIEDLKDEYDKYAVQIGAFDGENIIGAVRIILPSAEGFYVENDFNVDLPKVSYEKMAEISRFAVLKQYRNQLISFGLLKKAFEISRQRKIEYWIVVVPEKIKNHFSKSFGINFYPPKTKELTEEQKKVREKMINYYKTCNPSVFLISLKEIL